MLNHTRILLLAVAFVFMVTACGDDDESSKQAATPVPAAPAKPAQEVAPEPPVVVAERPQAIAPQPAAPAPVAQPAPAVTPIAEPPAAKPAESVTVPAPAPEPTPATESPAVAAPVASTPAPAASTGAGQTHTINAEARAFNPDIVYIQPGDTVSWINMTSHNSVSIDGLIPAGASPWRGQLGENLKVTLTIEGIYAYVCEPHIGFGMMGVIVVGKPANLADVKATADKNLQGPFRRIIGKLNKVVIP